MVVVRFILLIIMSLEKRNLFIISQKKNTFLWEKYTERCALQRIYSRIRV